MNKINLLFVILATKMGGAERLVYNIIRGLNRNSFNPSLAYFLPGEELKEFKKLEIPIYYIPIKHRVDFLSMNLLASLIREKKIDVVNCHLFKPFVYSFWGCKIRNNIKLTYTEHSAWEVNLSNLKWKIIGHFLLKKANKVIGISDGTRKALNEVYFLNKNKTMTIHNGVEIQLKRENIALKRSLGIEDKEKVIGIVANFRTVKNHIMLLKAFNSLIIHYSNVRLLLIGQGFHSDPTNSEQEIKDYLASNNLYNKVMLLGYRNDVRDLLNIMDIFCLTSFKEGLPISLIEAMSAQLPVVGTNVEGIRDLISPSKNGFLVEVNDIVNLKDSILRLLDDEDLCLKFGQESYKIVKEDYSINNCVLKYEQLFLSLFQGIS